MKDYRGMLSSLKDKVVDAAGKAGETVTNAAKRSSATRCATRSPAPRMP